MSRRGESIYKRSDGRWEARYIHHYENGQAKYRYLYARSYTEVKAKRQAELTGQLIAQRRGTGGRFGELAECWLAEIRPTVKESTFTRYHRTVRRYLAPTLGDCRIERLDCMALHTFAHQLLSMGGHNGRPLAPKTVGDILCVLKAICKFARRAGYPCPELGALTLSRHGRRQAEILSEAAGAAIEQRLWDSEDVVALGILFALYTGVRIGELCGLRWGDLDLDAGLVRICRTVGRIANLDAGAPTRTKVIVSEPKTASGMRVIPLPAALTRHLRRLAGEQDAYLLTGTPHHTEPHTFYTRYQTFLRRSGLPHFTFHALRHTFATRCIALGFDAKSLAEILGHADIATTLALYVHPTLEHKRSQMERLLPEAAGM